MTTNSYVILTQPSCPWCDKVKELIVSKGDTYVGMDISTDLSLKEFMRLNKILTVPAVFLGGSYMGGYQTMKFMYEGRYDGE